ncbi:hypothetical protein Rsub_09173 [Raphidocelis subcapitata]|uniref:Uncharacterized protein n=1 Tax=Raphidocelis subcapitata TaxID=307507 RepID=A0A2V0P936_9CHLO|nr:hypothetical protein Rsub_09173 [Raphidocelis subcapitata]|eukprot:GBF96374.1 hypothetical protein Rsub_09173 [Raphidocelis subcapitata]
MSKRRRIPSEKYAGGDWELDAADVEGGGGGGGGEGAAAEPAGGAPLAGVSGQPAGGDVADAGAGEGSLEEGEEGGSEGGGDYESGLAEEEGEEEGEEEQEAPQAQPPAKRVRAAAAAPKPRPKPAPRKQLEASTPAARREHLTAALEARGLEPQYYPALCSHYIRHGGSLTGVVDAVAEMKFYFDHTTYCEDYVDAEREGEEYEYFTRKGERRRGFFHHWSDEEEICEAAKNTALRKWVEEHGGPEDAVARPELPPSLAKTVLDYAWMWGLWR